MDTHWARRHGPEAQTPLAPLLEEEKSAGATVAHAIPKGP